MENTSKLNEMLIGHNAGMVPCVRETQVTEKGEDVDVTKAAEVDIETSLNILPMGKRGESGNLVTPVGNIHMNCGLEVLQAYLNPPAALHLPSRYLTCQHSHILILKAAIND